MISLDKFEEKMLLTNGRKKEVALDTVFNHLETAVIHIANDSKMSSVMRCAKVFEINDASNEITIQCLIAIPSTTLLMSNG